MRLVGYDHRDAKKMFYERYVPACTPEELKNSFDYPATFKFPLRTEHIYGVITDEGQEAAWGSFVVDAYGTSAACRIGVWPAFRRGGVWTDLLQCLRIEAFKDPNILCIRSMCLLSNAENAARMMKKTQTDWWYKFDGVSYHPPTIHVITTREDWFAELERRK